MVDNLDVVGNGMKGWMGVTSKSGGGCVGGRLQNLRDRKQCHFLLNCHHIHG